MPRLLALVAMLAAPCAAADPSVDELRAKVGALYAAQVAELGQTNDDFRETLARLEKAVERLEAKSVVTPALPQAVAPPAATCPCGDVCECGPGCTCPGCPHRTGEQVAAAPVGGKAGTVSRGKTDSGLTVERLAFSAAWCGNCKGCEYPAGVRIVDFDKEKALAQACGVESLPAYVVREGGKVVRREEGVKTFQQAETFYGGITSPVVTTTKAVVTREPARVIVNAPRRSPVIRNVPPASRRWTYSGSDLAGHLRREHGIDPTGRSYDELVRLHSHAHEAERGSGYSASVIRGAGGYVASPPVMNYAQPAPRMSSGCPGGRCPGVSSSRRSGGGWFGWGVLNR